ncbi:MAG: hypothetical protein RLZZ621_1595, partial [Gemmatimonadota bacterium]
PGVVWCGNPYETAHDADAVVVLTEWSEFLTLDFTALAATMRTPLLIDLRNAIGAERLERAEWRYRGIGRGEGSRPPLPRLTLL